MVKLVCAVVGAGSVFPVDIELSEMVDGLKKKIKEKKPGLIYFDADLLQLYLAREVEVETTEGETRVRKTWLNARDDAIKQLKAKRFPDRIKNLVREELLLEETWDLNDDEYFGTDFKRVEGDIHVLVDYPDELDQVNMWGRQDGFRDSFVENLFSWHSPWSSLQSLFARKEKQA